MTQKRKKRRKASTIPVQDRDKLINFYMYGHESTNHCPICGRAFGASSKTTKHSKKGFRVHSKCLLEHYNAFGVPSTHPAEHEPVVQEPRPFKKRRKVQTIPDKFRDDMIEFLHASKIRPRYNHCPVCDEPPSTYNSTKHSTLTWVIHDQCLLRTYNENGPIDPDGNPVPDGNPDTESEQSPDESRTDTSSSDFNPDLLMPVFLSNDSNPLQDELAYLAVYDGRVIGRLIYKRVTAYASAMLGRPDYERWDAELPEVINGSIHPFVSPADTLEEAGRALYEAHLRKYSDKKWEIGAIVAKDDWPEDLFEVVDVRTSASGEIMRVQIRGLSQNPSVRRNIKIWITWKGIQEHWKVI